MNIHDAELIRTAAADLAHLASEWGATITDDALRRDSVTLRRLLNDGDYARAWRAAGFDREPTVVAPRLERLLDSGALAKATIVSAGGGTYNGMTGRFSSMGINTGWLSDLATPNDEDRDYAWGLTRYLKSCGIFLDGRRVERREIIQFVANKLGGAHLDDSDIKLKSSVALRRYMDTLRTLGKNLVYFELMSIGQLVGRSDDAQRLIERGA